MDVLAQLELRVEQLLARLEMQKAEISRLAAEVDALRQENAELTSANHMLGESLARNKAARQEALKRVDALLARIRDIRSVD